MIAMMLVSAVAALAALRVWRLAVPAAPQLVEEVARWERTRQRTSRLAAAHVSDQTLAQRVASWCADQLRIRRPDEMASFDRDLAVTGQQLEAWLARTMAWTVAGIVAPFALVAAAAAVGIGIPLAAAPVLAVVFGGFMVFGQISDLHSKSAKAREDLREALSVFLDLVVMSMEGGRSHADALPTVAELGGGWAFHTLQDAIDNARPQGITPWEALGRVGEKYGVPELLDLRAAIALAADEGGSIRSTLIARAETMRDARVADAHARANTATDAMRNNTMMLALVAAAYAILARVLFLLTV